MSSQVLVQIVLGFAAIGAVLLVLRWAWNSRAKEGRTAEKAESLEDLIVEAADREEKVRGERALSHADWKRAGRKHRARRKP